MRVLAVITISGMSAGCQCNPPGPPANTDKWEPPPPDTDVPVDTAPPPRCSLEETEPNALESDADDLPLEVDACGWFQAPYDSDRWQFEVPVATWVGVTVTARENGSIADPDVVIYQQNYSVDRIAGDDTADVHLLMPMEAGPYSMVVTEHSQTGEDNGRFFYDIDASVQKAPRSWSLSEEEPNNTVETALVAQDGDSVFGVIGVQGDIDLLEIQIPEGRHTLTVSVDAFSLGSPADLMLNLIDAAGDSPNCPGFPDCFFFRDEVGGGSDPWLQYNSEGGETLFVKVRPEVPTKFSSSHWYVVDVQLEGE